MTLPQSFAELSARQRLQQLLDAGSFQELLGPAQRVVSPHLALLGVPYAFDDVVVIGEGQLDGQLVLIAAQEGEFMGGGVGEVHGAKLTGLLRRALQRRPAAVLILADSGGVRLHEANAGLIAVSEVMRALLDVRAAGIPVLILVGGMNGCFGGMGLISGCADHIVMSDTSRLSMSGPEVIESAHGVEEFDARDRAWVWRTTGGKHRYLLSDCAQLLDDDVQAFRQAAIGLLGNSRPVTLEGLLQEHALLADRLEAMGDCADARDVWQRLGLPRPEQVTDQEAAQVVAQRAGLDCGRTWETV
jgi:malonate decarboxylase beta subunit